MISFDKMSSKFFTHDPIIIKTLDALGYKRGKIKIDGVAVFVENMTDDEKARAQRNLERKAEKMGVEAPKIEPEVEFDGKGDFESKIETSIKEEIEAIDVKKPEEESKPEVKKEKEKKKSKASMRLKKEVEGK